mmetsp:Transcript_27506/g.51333  ORF Transcript_27506/g.51333 Transcript_27506/m.51333 type:complete len:112 (-) Transcript_27506:153-488(-)
MTSSSNSGVVGGGDSEGRNNLGDFFQHFKNHKQNQRRQEERIKQLKSELKQKLDLKGGYEEAVDKTKREIATFQSDIAAIKAELENRIAQSMQSRTGSRPQPPGIHVPELR